MVLTNCYDNNLLFLELKTYIFLYDRQSLLGLSVVCIQNEPSHALPDHRLDLWIPGAEFQEDRWTNEATQEPKCLSGDVL